jgi:hypothetical protein
VCDKERRENFTFLSWFTSCLSYVLGAAIIEWSVYLESIKWWDHVTRRWRAIREAREAPVAPATPEPAQEEYDDESSVTELLDGESDGED